MIDLELDSKKFENFLITKARPGLGIYFAKIHRAGIGYHFEIVLDGLDDPRGAVTVEDCNRFSLDLSREIDLESGEESLEQIGLPGDLTSHNYTMEVSSAGAERKLRIPHDLERFRELPLKLTFIDNGIKKTELVVFTGEGCEVEETVPSLIFSEYVPQRKRKKGTLTGRKSTRIGSPEKRLELNQIIKAHLYLDF